MGAALAVASVGAGVMSAYQQMRAGQIQKKVSYQQAALEEQDADRAIGASKEDARVIRYQGKQVAGSQVAGYSASGVTLEGSPLAVMQESRVNNELDAMKTEYGGELQARQLRQDATMRRYSGDTAYKSGMFGAGSTLLTSGFNAAGAYNTGRKQDAMYKAQMDYYKIKKPRTDGDYDPNR